MDNILYNNCAGVLTANVWETPRKLLRVYFLGLKNRGNRGTVVSVRINGLKCGVVAVMHCLRCLVFGLARLLS